ncbi:MAG: ribbon-helix-helix domain-containing protein [Polyangiaceae bacterium]
MPTSVHLPDSLLEAVDRKAKALKISRNQLIVRALERELRAAGDWSPQFFARLGEWDDELARDVDTLLKDVKKSRRSKTPRDL